MRAVQWARGASVSRCATAVGVRVWMRAARRHAHRHADHPGRLRVPRPRRPARPAGSRGQPPRRQRAVRGHGLRPAPSVGGHDPGGHRPAPGRAGQPAARLRAADERDVPQHGARRPVVRRAAARPGHRPRRRQARGHDPPARGPHQRHAPAAQCRVHVRGAGVAGRRPARCGGQGLRAPRRNPRRSWCPRTTRKRGTGCPPRCSIAACGGVPLECCWLC